MKANTKKYLKVLTSIGLVLAVAVGFTLAYLTADTGTKTNKFTGSDGITGETTETEWEYEDGGWNDFMPGDVAYKNPTVKISGDVDAYVGLRLTVVDKTEGLDANGNYPTMTLTEFVEKYGTFYYDADGNFKYPTDVTLNGLVSGMNTGKLADQWTPVGDQLFVYNSIIEATEAGASAKALFDAVQINAGVYKYYQYSSETKNVYKYQLDTDGNKIVESGVLVESSTFVSENEVLVDTDGNVVSDLKLPTFDIVIDGFAVQADNLTMAQAITEIKDLAKVKDVDLKN